MATLEDYQRHTDALRRALLACEAFVLTLGPTEAWKFAHSGDFTSVGPWKVEPTLVRAHNLTVEEHVEELERLLTCYKRHRPGIKIILIGLTGTARQDLFGSLARRRSQCVVQSQNCAWPPMNFASRHPEDVFYFPSYEIVIYGSANPLGIRPPPRFFPSCRQGDGVCSSICSWKSARSFPTAATRMRWPLYQPQ